tara:strand:+ start:2845 stop:4137 length:1293 start_codon:yes stop_codon:yes gene_type:complete
MLRHFEKSRSTIARFQDGLRHSSKFVKTANIAGERSQFNFNESLPFYGKVDYKLNPVQPNKQFLVPIGTTGGGTRIEVFDFVASAFNQLHSHIKRGASYDKISSSSMFINMSPLEGYVDLDASYKGYMSNIFSSFYGEYVLKRGRQDEIRNFKSFLKLFMEFYVTVMSKNDLLLTKSSFYLYTPNPLLHTGLAIKYSNASLDEVGEDPGYTFFTTAARKFGFLLNSSDPTVIVANFGNGGVTTAPPFSSQPQFEDKEVIFGMAKYMEEFGITYDGLFEERYYSIIYDEQNKVLSDFNLLKSYLLQFYENIILDAPAISISSPCNTGNEIKTNHKVIYREFFKYEDDNDFPLKFKQNFPDSTWLSLYLQIKMLETKKVLDYNKCLRTTMTYYKKNGLKTALFYINHLTKVIPTIPDGSYLAKRRLDDVFNS